ncbi:MAG: alkaline phosphatase family protein [Candidatus Micrarchaeota archaeon]
MRYLLVILDGAADRKNAELNGKTPLEAANMKNLNKIARQSLAGMMYPIEKGVAPESDSAVFSILSYNIKNYTGRGAMEALGAGLKVGKNDIALRANFATIDENRRIISRRCSLTEKEAKELEKEINKIKIKGVKIKFKATVDYRGALLISPRGRKLSQEITNVDIGYIKKGTISIAKAVDEGRLPIPKAKPLKNTKEAKFTAKIVNEFIDKAIEVLSKSNVNKKRIAEGKQAANAILLRDASLGLPDVEPIEKKFGIKFCFVTEMPVERGIAKLLKMHEIKFESAKRGIERYEKLAKIVNKNTRNCDFVYVHIKGPDEPGHAGDPKKKRDILKAIDNGFFSKLNLYDTRICVTCDHATPCSLKAHSSDPVPVIIGRFRNGDNLRFDENIDSKGSLGIFNGNELISKILHMDEAIK